MIREAKEPEERREQLLDVAEKLIIKKGFDNTTVSDIVKKANVAQGTFYYYFDTKDEVLNAIIRRYSGEMEAQMKVIVERDASAMEKIFALFDSGRRVREKRKGLTDYLHEERNELLHYRIERMNTPVIARYFSEIIRQGIREGVFNTEYPMEAALSILAASSTLGHGAIREQVSKEEIARLLVISLDLMERILGAKPGSFMEISKLMEGEK